MHYIEDLLQEHITLKNVCQSLLKKSIASRTWFEWERLAGATGRQIQGRKLKNRKYTQQQSERLLVIAWMRKRNPRMKLTYQTVSEIQSNPEFQEFLSRSYDEYIDNPPVSDKTTKIQSGNRKLSEVKAGCDKVMGRSIARDVWVRWKKHVGIPPYARDCTDRETGLLVQMAIFRKDYPNRKFPTIQKIEALTKQYRQRAMSLETVSASRSMSQWQMQGCKGKDLRRYLAAKGYRISESSLYRLGFKRNKHYHTYELGNWERLIA